MGEATFTKTAQEGYMRVRVPLTEISRIRKVIKKPLERAAVLAHINRLNTLYMIQTAGSGHIGTCMSSLDIVTYLWSEVLKNPNSDAKIADVYFSSKGHDAPALYAALIGLGKLPYSLIEGLRRQGGLPGHPDVGTEHIPTNTGSLGMGISKARGMAKAYRAQKRAGTFFVLTGDGELQEGQFWESLQPTANHGYANIVAIVDHNKIQSDTWVKDTSDLGDLEAKFAAFGWKVYRVDGHNMKALAKVIAATRKEKKRPQVIIADTVKGKGVPFMEKVDAKGIYNFHSGALSPEMYAAAVKHLVADINNLLKKQKAGMLLTEEEVLHARPQTTGSQSLIKAYGDALVAEGGKSKDFMVMDADLTKDLGLLPFKYKYPNRYIQAGIAEQDMVSFAGGLALEGITPVVNSFACFMTPRANEQMYNNATEHTKVVYMGGLAGILPGMPGHSHQSVRDIAIMSAHPELVVVEPTDEGEVMRAVEYALHKNVHSTYIRLVSVPWNIPFKTPAHSLDAVGVGTCLKEGKDLAVIAYGPIMTTEAYAAADEMEKQGTSVAVYNMPWLNRLDDAWFTEIAKRFSRIIVLDNHYVKGGLGEHLAAAVGRLGLDTRITLHGVTEIPLCGQNQEVLEYHRFDRVSLAQIFRNSLK